MQQDIEYERLTKEIYEALLHADGITSIDVQHNVKIQGQSSKHQIDVYWEYELAGIRHRVAIECKNYNKNVSKSVVTSFYGVLSDITNINGVIVTKKGFQKGAKEYAKHWGINLKEIRRPNDKDWEGRLKTIHAVINISSKSIKNLKIIVDEEWVKENIQQTRDEGLIFNIQGRTDEISLTTKSEETICSLLDLENNLPMAVGEVGYNLIHRFAFEDAYIKANDYGRIKINGLEYTYDVLIKSQTLTMDGGETAKAILKDAITGELKFFNNDGTIV